MATWTDRIWREFHAKNLTRSYRDVLLTLRTYRGHGGLICPSHETLADRARCSVSTAWRALQHARSLGLVSWAERRVRVGWRWLRTSNRYELLTPEAPVSPDMRPVWWRRPTNGQSDLGGEGLEKEEADKGRKATLATMFREAAGLPDLLALRRAAVEAKRPTK
jgi:DNA-binding transcriptional MocR family regulator